MTNGLTPGAQYHVTVYITVDEHGTPTFDYDSEAYYPDGEVYDESDGPHDIGGWRSLLDHEVDPYGDAVDLLMARANLPVDPWEASL